MPVNRIIEELSHRAQEIEQDVAGDIKKSLKDLAAHVDKSTVEPRHGFGCAFGKEY